MTWNRVYSSLDVKCHVFASDDNDLEVVEVLTAEQAKDTIHMVHYNRKDTGSGDSGQAEVVEGPAEKSNESSVLIDSSNTTSDDSVQAKETVPEKDAVTDEAIDVNDGEGGHDDNNADDDDDLEITGVEEAKATVIDEAEQENISSSEKQAGNKQTVDKEAAEKTSEMDAPVVIRIQIINVNS